MCYTRSNYPATYTNWFYRLKVLTHITKVAMRLFLLFYLSITLHKENVAKAVTTVTEVIAGHLAELPCLSSDDQHRFIFWQLTDDRHVIGPGNPLDVNKYNYEVLTGKLYIRGVSTRESGFYKCVSRGINDPSAVNVHVVELVVKKDWENVWENDFETNLLRSMTAVMVIVVAVAVFLFIITVKRKRTHGGFFDLEESRENSPTRFRGNIMNPSAAPAQGVTDGAIDNAPLDIDFPKVFTHMQRDQGLP